ncbi:bis(5'-nucleosyl)-tetraphosphatase (symmetrical) ApaH [Buchnera aphidicola]|uniref:Bis(5'-nucleosyl)-tetraphosphatase, symmetrical n=1 Tax=Buchnera aphidicola (Aphis gossypii) TaxID=98785 RepID=A0A5J6ZBI7_9GAMM|nr:bis(5'-nucleosyl)-tetraphosphatase (symmetrical) ApaH [Buchnera aphidicola]QFQ31988.1 bis(5'-nucleosyl)-tetraphosphatase (symmetrical) [Buchnera aphidicola (Aphis gossypii)]UPT14518.1 bis(5'-nucleosyl)-tetraphosphatase (symmetrical) ApaH [Buchnera aphidicola (Aphis gossypii)]
MSTYFISDIHGCYREFKILLKKSNFDVKKDYLWIAGDLVARGPNSLEVIRYLYSIKDRTNIVLGNHDLNLIAVYSGIKENKKENYFDDFLSSKDSDKLINWLRSQSILKINEQQKIIMIHAGISSQWDFETMKACALEIEASLLSNDYPLFLKSVFNNKINYWNSSLRKIDRLRYSVNAFTRMRYCYPNGKLNLICKKSPNVVKYPLLPWFIISNKFKEKYSVVFGHWSTLKDTRVPSAFFPLDKGCCWGGQLLMLRWEDKQYFYQSYLG